MKKTHTLRNSGGFLKHPTPGGVPVKIRSPGNRVQNFEHHETISSVLNTNCLVLESCLVTPLTIHFKFKWWGSAISSGVTIEGPIGQNPFIAFPRSH